MKKYKLIKTYPGSPKTIGLQIHQNGPFWQSNFAIDSVEHFHIDTKFNPQDYPEFWQEVIEKNYKILSYIDIQSGNIFDELPPVHHTLWIQFSPLYSKKSNSWISSNQLCEKYKINSVKRLSDSEILTIGDKTNAGTIKDFTLCKDDRIMVSFENNPLAYLDSKGLTISKLKPLLQLKMVLIFMKVISFMEYGKIKIIKPLT